MELFQYPKYRNKVFLHQKFIVERLSAAEIAKDFGRSLTTIKNHLRKFGIRKNTPNRKTRHNLALGEKLIRGKVVPHQGDAKTLQSIKDMHCREGPSARTIARILNSMKVPTKKRGNQGALVALNRRHRR